MAKSPLSVDIAWQHHRAGRFADAEKMYRQLLKKNPRNTDVMRLLGNALRRMNRVSESLEILDKAVRLRPHKANIQLEYGTALAQSGRGPEAIACFRQCIEIDPNSAENYLRLAHLHLSMFDVNGAITVLKEGLEKVPHNLALHRAAGASLSSQGSFREAKTHYQTVLAEQPDDIDAHCGMGLVLRTLGDLDEADAHLSACLTQNPDEPRALAGKADLLVSQGQTDAAMALIEQTIKKGVRHPDLASTYGRAAKSTKRFDDGIKLIEDALADPRLPQPNRAALNLVVGGLFEAKHDYDEAFARYDEGNRLYPQTFNEDLYRRAMDELVEVFATDSIGEIPTAQGDTSKAIFIVGMPRSGTSLVEQILACHPDVHGAGELGNVPRVIPLLPAPPDVERGFPFCLREVGQDVVNGLSESLLDFLTALAPDAKHVTDKLPQNYMHLGLISRLLPDAKVIYCRRDPLDNCLSCFATRLTPLHDYATNLRALGVVYNEHLRIMSHWREVLNLPIFEVPYENMVADQERMTRALVEFCGLEWHDDCLHFHESERHTATASIDQVKQPIYQTSMARAQRFVKHLGPLQAALNEPIRPR